MNGVCVLLALNHLATNLTNIHLACFQDSLSGVLENPLWHSERVDFTAVLQSAPVILEQISESVRKEKQFQDVSYNQQYCIS